MKCHFGSPIRYISGHVYKNIQVTFLAKDWQYKFQRLFCLSSATSGMSLHRVISGPSTKRHRIALDATFDIAGIHLHSRNFL